MFRESHPHARWSPQLPPMEVQTWTQIFPNIVGLQFTVPSVIPKYGWCSIQTNKTYWDFKTVKVFAQRSEACEFNTVVVHGQVVTSSCEITEVR